MPTWIATDGEWTVPAHWSGGVPNGIGAQAIFNSATNGGGWNIGIQDIEVITLGRLDVTLTGTTNLFIRGSTADTGTGTGRLVFDAGAIDATVMIDTTSATGDFTITGANGLRVELNTNTLFNVVNSGSDAFINASVRGAGTLIKSGLGTLWLNGTNTQLTGGIRIEGGVLHAQDDAALGTGGIEISNGGTFRSVGTVDNDIVVSSGIGIIAAEAATTLTLTGNLTNQEDLVFGGSSSSGTIVANFASIDPDPFDFDVTVQNSTLRLGNATVAANLFNSPAVFSGTTLTNARLDLAGFTTTIIALLVNNSTIESSVGALDLTLTSPGSLTNMGINGTAQADRLIINAVSNLSISLADLSFANWSANDLVEINGTSSASTLRGSTQRDTIYGFAGNDILSGEGGADTIDGGDNDDSIYLNGSNSGANVIGGAGFDTLVLETNSANISLGSISGIEAITLAPPLAHLTLTANQVMTGLASNTTLSGAGSVSISTTPDVFLSITGFLGFASPINFIISGSTGNDFVKGAHFNSFITGGAGVDFLRGGNGVDMIDGGSENDKITGWGGADIITGGSGSDQFRYLFGSDSGLGAASDRIVDFAIGSDKIDFRLLDSDLVAANIQNYTFTFRGASSFVNGGGAQIRYTNSGADLLVQMDLDGNGGADMEIILQGLSGQSLTLSDFLLVI